MSQLIYLDETNDDIDIYTTLYIVTSVWFGSICHGGVCILGWYL